VGPPIPDVADFVVDTFASLHDGAGVVLTVLFALLVAAGLVLHRRTGRHPLPVALVALLLVPLLAVALPQVPPFQRSWSYLAIFEVIVIAAGVVGLAKLVGERRQRHLRRLGPALVGCGTLLLGIVVSIGAPPGNEDPPVLGARATLRALAQENPQAPLVVSPFSFPSFAVSARLEGYGGPLLVEAPDPALPPALLAVSRSRGETPQAVMEFDGFGPNPPAVHFERRIGEVDLYRFGS
jgi:hypothetical protein